MSGSSDHNYPVLLNDYWNYKTSRGRGCRCKDADVKDAEDADAEGANIKDAGDADAEDADVRTPM